MQKKKKTRTKKALGVKQKKKKFNKSSKAGAKRVERSRRNKLTNKDHKPAAVGPRLARRARLKVKIARGKAQEAKITEVAAPARIGPHFQEKNLG